MKAKPTPDQKFLQACLNYDPNTGALHWKVRPEWTFEQQGNRTPQHIARVWNASWAGKPALNSTAKNGYLKGSVDGVLYYAHRIIYKLQTGLEPPADIDHDDGNRQNNRWKNLIQKDRTGNMRNRALSSNNTSGFHGVSYSNRHKLWAASIHHENKPIHLGWFKEKDAAVAARQTAEKQYGYHPNHGKRSPT